MKRHWYLPVFLPDVFIFQPAGGNNSLKNLKTMKNVKNQGSGGLKRPPPPILKVDYP
jgi:hypothetical protein